MAPARSRPVLEDSRSETSSTFTTLKEKVNTGTGLHKSKKLYRNTVIENLSGPRAAVVAAALSNMNGTATNGSTPATGATQTDWSSVSISTLHAYRAAYRIQTPSSYTYPHADLLYNSSEIGQRAPSQVLARKALRDLKLHRRKMTQINGQASGIYKRFKQKEKDRDKDETSSQSSQSLKKRVKDTNHIIEASIAQSIEPSSPTVVSQSQSVVQGSDHASSSTLLNASDPESTIIGRQSPTSLATSIRKHFNAQQLNEAETIARFTYVTRQHGYGSGAATAGTNSANTTNAVGNNFTPTHTISTPIRVEGSAGDGDGWIMGSMGRQVRMCDTGVGAAFRLRFRP